MRRLIPLMAAGLIVGLPMASRAQPPEARPSAAEAAEPAPLPLQELGQISGGQAFAVVSTDQALNAVNTGNSINAASVRSGDIDFTGLSNFAGVGNFVVNTGANNNLQGSLSVTVVAAPAVTR
jgi:hypothetical protein